MLMGTNLSTNCQQYEIFGRHENLRFSVTDEFYIHKIGVEMKTSSAKK